MAFGDLEYVAHACAMFCF